MLRVLGFRVYDDKAEHAPSTQRGKKGNVHILQDQRGPLSNCATEHEYGSTNKNNATTPSTAGGRCLLRREFVSKK